MRVLRRPAEPHARGPLRTPPPTTPAFGLGCRAASRRHAASAASGRPARDRRHSRPPADPSPGRAGSSRRRRVALQPNRTGRSAETGDRSSRRGCWRRGTPAAREPRRRAPQHSGATAASEVFSATDSSAARASPSESNESGSRPHSDGSRARAPSMSLARQLGSAISAPVRASDVPPSATNVAAAVDAAVHAGPRRAAARSSATPRGEQRPDQSTGVRRARRAAVGVGQPSPAPPHRCRTAPPGAHDAGRPSSRSAR